MITSIMIASMIKSTIKPRQIYRFSLGLLLGSTIFSAPGYAASELSDRALRQATENNHSQVNVPEVLDCDTDMRQEECNRLQYERYANNADRSYDEFLRNETVSPLRTQVIKQPLLTQPLENPGASAEPRPDLDTFINQLPSRLPVASTGIRP